MVNLYIYIFQFRLKYSFNNANALSLIGSRQGSGSDNLNVYMPEFSSFGICIEGISWGTIGSSGGRLVVPEYGVSLMVPEGALPPDMKQNIYIAVITRPKNPPVLTERQVSMRMIVLSLFQNDYSSVNILLVI